MSADTYEQLLTNIRQVLTKNGFPARRVALPLERMYEVAHAKGLNFNKALTLLAEQGVAHEKTTEKIIFFAAAAEDGEQAATPTAPNPADILAQANAMLKDMPPERLQQLEELYRTMTDEQRSDMMRKAKEMGLF